LELAADPGELLLELSELEPGFLLFLAGFVDFGL
jgi:hypothetical protein